MVSLDWIRNVVLDYAEWDSHVQQLLDRMYLKEEDLYRKGKDVDLWKEFYEVVKEKLRKAVRELGRKGVDVEKIGWRSLKRMVGDKFIQWAENWFDSEAVDDDIIVYGETMGFVLREGSSKWQVFEGSDEPGRVDMELYRKLIVGEKKSTEKMTLYGVHDYDFVRQWNREGIPENVYFAEEKWIARRYWHEMGDDVLVEVKLPLDAIVKTAEEEWMTVRWVEPNEFRLRVL